MGWAPGRAPVWLGAWATADAARARARRGSSVIGFMAGKFIPIREWLANGVEMKVSVGGVILAEQFSW